MNVGDRCKVRAKLVRKTLPLTQRYTARKEWHPKDTKEIECISIGTRRLSDGVVTYDNVEGHSYTPRLRHKALLMVDIKGTTAPFYVTEDMVYDIRTWPENS